MISALILLSGQLCTTMAVSTLPEAPDFDTWLTFKLKSLDTDETVFGSYIKGILEGEESQDEKIEAIEGLLAEIAPVKKKTCHCRNSMINIFHYLIVFLHLFSQMMLLKKTSVKKFWTNGNRSCLLPAR